MSDLVGQQWGKYRLAALACAHTQGLRVVVLSRSCVVNFTFFFY